MHSFHQAQLTLYYLSALGIAYIQPSAMVIQTDMVRRSWQRFLDGHVIADVDFVA